MDFVALVRDRLDALDFAGKRDALDALGVHVAADGRAWSTAGADPDTGAGVLTTSSGRMPAGADVAAALPPAHAAARPLYLCGASTHPGGNVLAATGRDAALAALADLAQTVAEPS